MICLDCGDIDDVTNNKGVFIPDSACSVACSGTGDGIHTCGGAEALDTYFSSRGSTWRTPSRRTPSNTGRFVVRIFFFFFFFCTAY